MGFTYQVTLQFDVIYGFFWYGLSSLDVIMHVCDTTIKNYNLQIGKIVRRRDRGKRAGKKLTEKKKRALVSGATSIVDAGAAVRVSLNTALKSIRWTYLVILVCKLPIYCAFVGYQSIKISKDSTCLYRRSRLVDRVPSRWWMSEQWPNRICGGRSSRRRERSSIRSNLPPLPSFPGSSFGVVVPLALTVLLLCCCSLFIAMLFPNPIYWNSSEASSVVFVTPTTFLPFSDLYKTHFGLCTTV